MDLLVFIPAAIYLFKVVTKTHFAAFEHFNVNRDVQTIYETIVIRKGKIVWKHGPYLAGF